MASRAYLPLSVRPVALVALDDEHLQKPAPSTSSSSPGSLLIRAPLTVDDSEYESNGEFDVSSNGTVYDSEIQSEGFVSGEDSERAPARPIVVNQEEDPINYNVSEEDEEESINSYEIDEPEVLVEDTILRIMPFAQLSGYDDEEEKEEQEVLTDLESGEVLGGVRVPSVDVSENFVCTPRVKVLDAEEEKLQPLVIRGSLAVSQSLLEDDLALINDVGLDNLIEAENGVVCVQADKLAVEEYGLDRFLEDKVDHGEGSISMDTNTMPQCMQNNLNIEQFENFASSELEEKELTIDGINGLEVKSKETAEMLEVTSNLVGDTSIVNATQSELVGEEIKLAGINGLDVESRETTEMVKGASIMVVGTGMLKSASSELGVEGIGIDGINGLKVGNKEPTAMVEGTSVMAGDTSILQFDIKDYSNSRMSEQDTGDNHLEKHNPTTYTDFNGTVQPVLGTVGENIEYIRGEPTFCLPHKRIAADTLEQESEHEKLMSINESAIDLKLHSCSDIFESCNEACEGNKILSAESSESSGSRLLEGTICMENGMSGTILGITQEAEPYSDYQSHEHVETNLDLGDVVQKEAAVDSDTRGEESKQDGLSSEGNVEGLISVDLEQFMEQVSAFSTFLGSNGSGKNSQQEQADRSSNEKINLLRDDVKKQFVYASSTHESDGSRVTITSADESSIISLKGPASCSSLHHFEPQAGLENNISEKEKEKIQKIHGMAVKFLRLVQRINFSSEDSFVSKFLCRLVMDIGKCSNQEFVINSAKILAKKLEDDDKDDLNFSLNILVLGKGGVGKSATINSIFGERKVATNAFEPATTSAREIAGTIDGIKIRILDTPGLRSSMKEQAFNRKILLAMKKHMKKLAPDVILYVDRVDTQTGDFSDLPLLRLITISLGPLMWQRTILTLTHAASTPLDGPSGSPLGYEVFVAEKSRLVQQSISKAVGDLCQVNPSFTCPVSLVENHSLNGKNINGECVLPNGLRWRSQLLLSCFSLRVLSGLSSMSGPWNLFDHWKQLFFQNHSPPLEHMLSPLMQSNAHLKFSGNSS